MFLLHQISKGNHELNCSPLNFLPRQFKTHIELFSTFLGESREKPNVIFEKETGEKPRSYNFSCLISMSQLVYSDQFKPVRIGENLVLNYNARYCSKGSSFYGINLLVVNNFI